MKVSRRKAMGTAIGAGIAWGVAPYAYAAQRQVLRVLGTHVTLQEEIRKQAEKDLGLKIYFQPGGSARVIHKAATRPESFDLYEQWSNSMRLLWQAQTIQPIEIDRITYWDEINSLAKTGKLSDDAKLGAGDAPTKLLYVQDDNTLGDKPTSRISFLPYVHNVDSFGYNADVVPPGKAYETESWAWLLDDKWRGRVALVNEPTIGLFDAALAVEAMGAVKFKDIGNLTKEEVDKLFRVLIDLRRGGYFRGVWSDVSKSVDLMKRGEVVIESMFSPAVFRLRAEGVKCVYASPKEGYRAWHGVMCLSSKIDGARKDAAYQYMNWWLSGWPGAFIARQGYYISNPGRAQEFLSDDEWNYWYEGKPASNEIKGTDGRTVAAAGQSRDGGSYVHRFSNIAVWNTVMSSYEYSLRAWDEFLSAT